MIGRIVVWLEQLGGVRPAPAGTPLRAVALGLWWLLLLLVMLAFAGRFTKFVYVDF